MLEELALLPAKVIVQAVDDGSGAEEASKLSAFVESLPTSERVSVRPVLRLPDNIGKGGTVHAGWDHLVQECDWLAFVDADGAVPAGEVRRLLADALQGPEKTVWFASRVHAEGVERSPLRDLVGFSFRLLTRLLVRLPVRDTQCGLKALPSSAYREIRPELNRRDFAFDIELALALHQRGYSLHELPIHWREQPGGHVRARHALIMALAVFGFGVRRLFGPKRK